MFHRRGVCKRIARSRRSHHSWDFGRDMMDHGRIARKITLVLFLSQGLSSAGFIAAFTVNALVAVETDRVAGDGRRARRSLRVRAGMRRPGMGLQHGANRPKTGPGLRANHRGRRIGDRDGRRGRPLLLLLPGRPHPGGDGPVGGGPGSFCRGGGAPAGGTRAGHLPRLCWGARWVPYADPCWWAPRGDWQRRPGSRSWRGLTESGSLG